MSIVPRGYEFTSHTPDGEQGKPWKARYGVVGLDALEKDIITDGMNEEGLVVGFLFFPGFAEFQPYDPGQADISVSNLELANLILSKYATVDEVRNGLKKIKVVSVDESALGVAVPIHFSVIEPNGKAIVIQYLKGEVNIHDNPLGVLTNSPPFDWHMTNLRNYINLSAVAWPAKRLEKIDFGPIGAGSGLLGMPGGFTRRLRVLFVPWPLHEWPGRRRTEKRLFTKFSVLWIISIYRLVQLRLLKTLIPNSYKG